MPKIKDLVPAQLLRPNDWNAQWLHDFRQWYGALYFYSHSEISKVTELGAVKATEMWGLQACSDMLPLWIWADGSDIVGKKVLEIGCGPGLLGKQLAFSASSYVGIDQAPLAVDIARGVSPANCSYYYAADEKILEHAGTVDTMVSRYFFIHQNYENAQWVLRLARVLLKKDGVVWADFFDGPTGIPCRESSQDKHPTSGYNFTDEDLQQLAAETGFTVINSEKKPAILRRFVKLAAR